MKQLLEDNAPLLIDDKLLTRLVQWLKLPAWKIRDRRFKAHSALQVSKKQYVSSPLTRNDSIFVGNLRDRKVVCSDGQCLNFDSYVCRVMSSYSLHHPQEVLQAYVSQYVHRWPKIPFISVFIQLLIQRLPPNLRMVLASSFDSSIEAIDKRRSIR